LEDIDAEVNLLRGAIRHGESHELMHGFERRS
jgi:hypothetical protein